MTHLPTSADYHTFVSELKQRVREARLRASLAVNCELILLYWSIGQDILERQQLKGWGSKIVQHLSKDLRRAFPDMKGFSVRNLNYMKAFAQAWPTKDFVQQAAAQIPWFHNITILEKVKGTQARRFYVENTRRHGWSRSLLALQIESSLHNRQGKAVTNFSGTLPQPQSDLAQQITKDPYCFDFLTLHDEALERDLERRLVEHIRDFLLELGAGFSFVGTQVHLEVADQDFYLDMLFYHLKLRCFVVIELKADGFAPEQAGKLNFYLSVVDEKLRHPGDQPSIGMLLCKHKNDVLVEYALRDINKPIGVSRWETKLVESLPDNLKGSLPSVEQLQAELMEAEE